MAKTTITETRAASALDPMWAQVAIGAGPADWVGKLPDDVRAATLDKVPTAYRDRILQVDMADEATIRFTLSFDTP